MRPKQLTRNIVGSIGYPEKFVLTLSEMRAEMKNKGRRKISETSSGSHLKHHNVAQIVKLVDGASWWYPGLVDTRFQVIMPDSRRSGGATLNFRSNRSGADDRCILTTRGSWQCCTHCNQPLILPRVEGEHANHSIMCLPANLFAHFIRCIDDGHERFNPVALG